MRFSRVALLALVSWLVCAALPASAQVAVVQGDCVNGNLFNATTTYVYSYPSALTPGNLVVIGLNSGANRSISSMAGSTTTYAVAGAGTVGGTGTAYLTYAIAAGGDATVTITLSGTESNDSTLCFAEFSGVAADQGAATHNGGASSSATTHDSGSVTPATAHNVIVNYAAHTTGTYTFDAAFTRIDAAGSGNGFMGYLIQTTATAQEANHTSAATEFMTQRISAFVGAGGAGAPPKNRLLLMGVGGGGQ